MYYVSQTPFEALERALGRGYSHPSDQHRVLQVLNEEHAKVCRWKVNLRKLDGVSSAALAGQAAKWVKGNEVMLRGLEDAYLAVSGDDDAALAKAREMLKVGHDLLRQGGGVR